MGFQLLAPIPEPMVQLQGYLYQFNKRHLVSKMFVKISLYLLSVDNHKNILKAWQ